MDKHPFLESADPPRLCDDDGDNASVTMLLGKSWPSIEELIFHIPLDINKWIRWFPQGAHPHLKHLILRTPILPQDEEAFSKFLGLHGGNLETIELAHDFAFGGHSSIPKALFPILSGYCPKLSQVIWTISDLDDLTWRERRDAHGERSGHAQLPNITSFTLQTLEHPKSVVVDLLYHWVRCLPNIHRIVLLEAELNVLRVEFADKLQTFASWLNDTGRDRNIKIALEDEYGVPVTWS